MKMNKKRILHLISGLEIGGAEKQLLRILPELQGDFDNRVCCIRGHGSIGKLLEKKGIKVHYLNIKNIFSPNLIVRFKRVVEEFKPDTLVTYLIHADLYGRVLAKLCGIRKVLCSQRGILLNWEWLRFFDRLTKSLVTKYTVQTEVTKKELMQKLKLPEKKFIIIPNGIMVEEFDFDLNVENKKAELNINPNNLNVVCVSNLRIKKGHEFLLEAFEKTYKTNNNINLLIVGDGDRKKSLIEQVRDYDSRDNIYFLGNRNDVREILKKSDIFVLPTLGEGMSNAILEALASSLPVITTNIPVNAEIITDNVDGLLVSPKQSKELADKIKFLIDNPEIREKIGANGRSLVEREYAISKISSKWSGTLKNL